MRLLRLTTSNIHISIISKKSKLKFDSNINTAVDLYLYYNFLVTLKVCDLLNRISENVISQSTTPNSSGPDVMETLRNLTSTVDDKMKNLTDTVTALESRMRQLESTWQEQQQQKHSLIS